ncbi:unnamed protein product, partial [marine sediment metagenome]
MKLIESIQNFDGASSTSGVTNVTITAVDMARTWIICTNENNSGDPEDYKVGYVLTSSTNVEIRTENAADNSFNYMLQVIQFSVASGIQVYRNSGTFDGSIGSQTDAIGATIDQSECHIDVNGHNNGTALGSDDFMRVWFPSNTQVEIDVNNGNCPYNWQVVDWNAHCKVISYDVSRTTSQTPMNFDITIAGADVDWNKRICIGSAQSTKSNPNMDEVYGRVYPDSNTTIHHQRWDNNAQWTMTIFVIEFSSPSWTSNAYYHSMAASD